MSPRRDLGAVPEMVLCTQELSLQLLVLKCIQIVQ